MLFHVTATHTPENCPLYNPEAQAAVMEAAGKIEAVAKELNVKVQFAVTGAPDHVIYYLLEADDMGGIIRFLGAIPIKQDHRITPVQPFQAVAATLDQAGR